jgi:hypothetical protein
MRKKSQYLPGDHIKVFRLCSWPLVFPHSHHGIYAGRDQVIHYSDEKVIKISKLADFAEDGHPVKVKHENPSFNSKEIIQRAKSRIGESDYNLLTNNCEHFCNWCIDGVKKSTQVKIAGALGTVVLSGIIAYKALKGDSDNI